MKLTAHLVIAGAAQAIEFYKAAFDAVELFRAPSDDGRLMHATLQIGESQVYLCDDFPEYWDGKSRAPAKTGTTSVTLHLDVPDCDAAMAKAVAAGGTIALPAGDMFWGARYGKVVDPFGHEWSLSHPIAPPTGATPCQ
jgi:PhnB protein